MTKLDDVVRSLTKPKAGGKSGDADKQNMILGLKEYSQAQKQRGILLIFILFLVLIIPIILSLAKIPANFLPYLLGGSGVFTIGTVKLLLDRFQDISTAHTLAIVCQGLDSKDAKDILVNWLKEKEQHRKS